MAPIHAEEVDGAVLGMAREQDKCAKQKVLEFVEGHLSRRHRKLSMTMGAKTGRMTVNFHVVGTVREDHVGLLAAHERGVGQRVEGITAEETVAAQCPEVISTRYRCPRRLRGQGVRWIRVVYVEVERFNSQIDFGRLESRYLDVKAEVDDR